MLELNKHIVTDDIQFLKNIVCLENKLKQLEPKLNFGSSFESLINQTIMSSESFKNLKEEIISSFNEMGNKFKDTAMYFEGLIKKNGDVTVNFPAKTLQILKTLSWKDRILADKIESGEKTLNLSNVKGIAEELGSVCARATRDIKSARKVNDLRYTLKSLRRALAALLYIKHNLK